MSATEVLRQLLDERGVEYTDRDMFGKHVFHWGTPAVDGAMFTDGGAWTELVVENATPEQAIEATLGRGTCHMEYNDGWSGDELYPTEAYNCSECGFLTQEGKPNYCPHCGRRVIGEEDE